MAAGRCQLVDGGVFSPLSTFTGRHVEFLSCEGLVILGPLGLLHLLGHANANIVPVLPIQRSFVSPQEMHLKLVGLMLGCRLHFQSKALHFLFL